VLAEGAGIEETLTYMAFARERWRSLRTNNMSRAQTDSFTTA
jgi:hypothetical protein